jgi:hypothetical protein
MTTPEPCLERRCYSPLACEGFGYCRTRNSAGSPTLEDRARWRRQAAERKAEAERAQAEMFAEFAKKGWAS